jgi:predicted nuclease of predicted toxin-antitoxin system
VNVKLLLDENVSPKVAEILRGDGVDAAHVRDRALLEADDATVLERAFGEDRILVTCNVDDFVKLARAQDIHADIVLLEDGDLLRGEQLQVLRTVVEKLASERDFVNRVMRVWRDGTIVCEGVPAELH